MPMIDVYATNDLFPSGTERQLGEELTFALLRAEGVPNPGSIHLNNTGVYLHRMRPPDVQPAGSSTLGQFVFRSCPLLQCLLVTVNGSSLRRPPKSSLLFPATHHKPVAPGYCLLRLQKEVGGSQGRCSAAKSSLPWRQSRAPNLRSRWGEGRDCESARS